MLLSSYQKVNQSFNKRLVFRLGIDAGFFSEFNNMILAMAWCLENQIEFRLYSKKAWFGSEGWDTFFEPFCKAEKNTIHDRINNRLGAPENKFHRYITIKIYKALHPNNQLTHEVWKSFRNREWEMHRYDFHELNVKGGLQAVCKGLVQMIWHYNEETNAAIVRLVEENEMGSSYVGFHIRGGDKYLEDRLYGFSEYLDKMAKHTNIRKAFILTDDYQAYVHAQETNPEWEMHTLCEKDEKGYFHQDFMRMPKEYIKRKTLRLLASVDILKNAELFMGTFSSNPGMFIGMQMEAERCLSVDNMRWQIW